MRRILHRIGYCYSASIAHFFGFQLERVNEPLPHHYGLLLSLATRLLGTRRHIGTLGGQWLGARTRLFLLDRTLVRVTRTLQGTLATFKTLVLAMIGSTLDGFRATTLVRMASTLLAGPAFALTQRPRVRVRFQ